LAGRFRITSTVERAAHVENDPEEKWQRLSLRNATASAYHHRVLDWCGAGPAANVAAGSAVDQLVDGLPIGMWAVEYVQGNERFTQILD
jgi:hypothetical protein